MDQLLVCISYETKNKIVDALFESIAVSECQLINMHLSSIGTDYQTITLILSGSWNQLTRFKTRLSTIKEHYPINLITQDVKANTYATDALPYEAYITMPAHSKTLHRAICFFLSLPFTIHKISIVNYKAPLTQTPMLEITLVLVTLSSKSINDYRENILQFSEENNFEVILESKRT